MTGLTTKQVAAKFGITGKELRRILRSFDRYDDGKYTRYLLSKRDIDQVAKRLANAKPEPKPVAKKKATRKPKPEQPKPEAPTGAPGSTEQPAAA